MNVERAFDNVPRFDNEEYKRLMNTLIERKPVIPLLDEVKEIFVAKRAIDIYKAEKRAKGCGCGNCFKDFEAIKEWYK